MKWAMKGRNAPCVRGGRVGKQWVALAISHTRSHSGWSPYAGFACGRRRRRLRWRARVRRGRRYARPSAALPSPPEPGSALLSTGRQPLSEAAAALAAHGSVHHSSPPAAPRPQVLHRAVAVASRVRTSSSWAARSGARWCRGYVTCEHEEVVYHLLEPHPFPIGKGGTATGVQFFFLAGILGCAAALTAAALTAAAIAVATLATAVRPPPSPPPPSPPPPSPLSLLPPLPPLSRRPSLPPSPPPPSPLPLPTSGDSRKRRSLPVRRGVVWLTVP